MIKQPIIEVTENGTTTALYFDHTDPNGLYVVQVERPRFALLDANELRKLSVTSELPLVVQDKIVGLRKHGYDLATNDVAAPRRERTKEEEEAHKRYTNAFYAY